VEVYRQPFSSVGEHHDLLAFFSLFPSRLVSERSWFQRLQACLIAQSLRRRSVDWFQHAFEADPQISADPQAMRISSTNKIVKILLAPTFVLIVLRSSQSS